MVTLKPLTSIIPPSPSLLSSLSSSWQEPKEFGEEAKFSFFEFFRIKSQIIFGSTMNVWMHDHPRDQHTFVANRKQKYITNLLVEPRLKFGIRNQTGIWKLIKPIYFMAKGKNEITSWKWQKLGGRLREYYLNIPLLSLTNMTVRGIVIMVLEGNSRRYYTKY